jgi:hypothetical protein
LHGAHAAVSAVNFTKLELRSQAGIVDKLWKGVGETTSTNIVNELDGVVVTHRNTGVDNLLSSALNLGIASLDTGEIKIRGTLSRSNTRGGTATKTNEHGRATQDNKEGAGLNNIGVLKGVLGTDGTDTTSNHDGLVVTTDFLLAIANINLSEKGTEISGCARTTELVVKSGTANRSLQHNIQAAGDVVWLANIKFPGLFVTRDHEVGDTETGETGLGARATANSAFITDLTTGTSGSTWVRGNGSRVVVSLNLSKEVNEFLGVVPLASGGVRSPKGSLATFQNGSVV